MLLTIERYLLKEVVLTFFATVVILLAMVLANRLAGYLNQVAGGLLARDAVFMLLGLQAIRFLVVLMPLALLLSIMLALGRLYRDSEIVALTACGVGPALIYRSLFLLAVPLALAMIALSLYVVPLCMDLLFELQTRARNEAEISLFTPGTFREVDGGQQVVYVGAIEDNGRELRKVFIQTLLPEGIAITTGEQGHQRIDADSGVRYMILNDGYRYEGNPGQGDYRNLHFRRLTVRIESAPNETGWQRREAIPTSELWRSPLPSHAAELHHRFSSPVILLMVTLLAPMLAHANPREGRYARVVAAVLIYAIYTNLLEVGQSWMARGQAWSVLGFWSVHGLFALLAMGLWIYQYGAGVKLFRRLAAAKQGS